MRSSARRSGGRPDDDLRRAALRLTAQFTALVLILLAVVGGIVFAIVAKSVAESNERALVAATQIDSAQDAPNGTFVTIVDAHDGGQVMTAPGMPDDLLDTAALQSVAAGGGDVRSERTVDGRRYLLLTTSSTGDRNHDRVVQVALDEHESAEELTRLATALLIAAGVAAVLAFVAAYVMARRAIRPLAEALALQRRFVADASHELRTPLTLLSTRAQLLKRRGRSGLPDDVTASVEEIVTDTRALTEILDDLLIAADPRSVAEPTDVDVAEVADEAVALLRDDAHARGLALSRSGGADPVVVSGSRAALLRLVIALANNALDHARGTVDVDVTTAGTWAVLRVSDDGPGFSPEIAANAFERFASGRAAGSSEAEGSRHYGLGLSIVAEITRRHHGTVTIDRSAPGGAVVCSIPLAAPARGR
ncbi:sensor histidine kinase [Herbiconiux sp. UC225_62]|uniref:sensor histidine kinase n=1 Tax=Herbiconiux sp. UC225_62 TaxID=3350168 RepID=UPI0036D23B73